MLHDKLPTTNIYSVALGYLLHALRVTNTQVHVLVSPLPDATIQVAARGAVLSVTAAEAPTFRNAVATMAAKQRCDVVLMRVAAFDKDFVHIAVDLSLGLLPGADPWPMNELEPWVSGNGALWLVPQTFGPAVSIGADGFMLELVPPYCTMAQRSAGVLRASGELARLMHTSGAAVR